MPRQPDPEWSAAFSRALMLALMAFGFTTSDEGNDFIDMWAGGCEL